MGPCRGRDCDLDRADAAKCGFCNGQHISPHCRQFYMAERVPIGSLSGGRSSAVEQQGSGASARAARSRRGAIPGNAPPTLQQRGNSSTSSGQRLAANTPQPSMSGAMSMDLVNVLAKMEERMAQLQGVVHGLIDMVNVLMSKSDPVVGPMIGRLMSLRASLLPSTDSGPVVPNSRTAVLSRPVTVPHQTSEVTASPLLLYRPELIPQSCL